MTSFNPGTPQAGDLPSDSQDEFLTNFEQLNQYFGVDHIPFGNTVQNATVANPCVCTSTNHGLSNGNSINIVHFGGLVGDIIQPWSINGGPYTVTVINANTFSINVSSIGNPPYLANTGAFSCTTFPYGFHKKISFSTVLSQGPNNSPPLGNPYSALYPKEQSNLAQLFFQDNVGASFEEQLTQLNFVEPDNANGRGVVTPWGVIINFGEINFKSSSQTYTFPIPYTSTVWALIGTLQLKTIPKNHRPYWRMNVSSLTQFTAFERTSDPTESLANVPGWYFAIGV